MSKDRLYHHGKVEQETLRLIVLQISVVPLMYQQMQQSKTGIEQPSHIAENVLLGENIYVGAFVAIASNVKIGKNCKIYPHVYIDENVSFADPH